jgi:hypothetical protein
MDINDLYEYELKHIVEGLDIERRRNRAIAGTKRTAAAAGSAASKKTKSVVKKSFIGNAVGAAKEKLSAVRRKAFAANRLVYTERVEAWKSKIQGWKDDIAFYSKKGNDAKVKELNAQIARGKEILVNWQDKLSGVQ